MDLQSDSQGFLLGEARLKEIASGIDGVSDNTQAILDILTTQAAQVKDGLKQVVREISSQNRSNRRSSRNGRDSGSAGNTRNASQNSSNRRNSTARNQPIPTETPAERMERIRRNRQASNPNNPLNNPASTRRRGANGRFEGAGANDSQNSDSSPNNANGRRRGANGRFESDGSTEQSGLQKLGKIIGDSVGQSLNVDTQGVDPLLDSMRELNQIITPGKRAFTLMGRGALWLFKRNRKPEISDEQDDANDQANRNDVTRNKLLQKLIDAVRAGRGGGGLLGGLLGGGRGMFGMLGKLGKGFLKRIPLLGTLLGGGMLASNWDGLDKEGKYEGVGGVAGAGIGAVIGGTLGSVVPVVGTAIGAMVGGVVGNWLGENAGKKLSEWTDYLESEDIGGNIGRAWTTFTTGMATWFKERYGAIADGIKTGFDTIFDLFKVIPNFIQNGFDQILAKFGNEDAKARIAARQQAEQQKQAKDAQDKPAPETKPQTLFERVTDSVKNAFDGVLAKFGSDDAQKRIAARDNKPMVFRTGQQPTTISGVLSDSVDALKGGGQSEKGSISKIIVAKNGKSNTLQMSDGSVVERTGNRNWRNNNPGNIEYGDFAKKNGAIGSDGRFAIFPSYGSGRKAKENLIFSGKSYRNLDLMGAINRYAPPSENDTRKYQQIALAAANGQNKKMSDYTPEERRKIMDAMERHEGMKAGKVRIIKPATTSNATSHTQATKIPTPTNADDLAKLAQNAAMPTAQAVVKPTTQVPFAMPTSMPTKSPFSLKIPAMPAVSNKLSGNPTAANINVTAPQSDIRQNVGDRTIAHIVTGGFGMQGMDV